MEKALTKVGSLKVGSLWISKKAKEELSNISEEITTLSSTVEEKAKWIFNKLKGSPPKTLPDLLREYNLPPGLFPQNITCYEFDETKARLIVYLPSPCEVSFKDSSVIRFVLREMIKKLLGVWFYCLGPFVTQVLTSLVTFWYLDFFGKIIYLRKFYRFMLLLLYFLVIVVEFSFCRL